MTALNLINNPIEFPPLDVVKNGIKYVQDFLRQNMNEGDQLNKYKENDKYDDESRIIRDLDDVWASEDENEKISHRRSVSARRMTKSALLRRR